MAYVAMGQPAAAARLAGTAGHARGLDTATWATVDSLLRKLQVCQ